jgi:Stress responsive A/B Barrel Domain
MLTTSSLCPQDGKPYILACQAGQVGPDPRSKGWSIAAKTRFQSKADMDYYDNECEAHKQLKMVAKPLAEDVMTVWFVDVVG